MKTSEIVTVNRKVITRKVRKNLKKLPFYELAPYLRSVLAPEILVYEGESHIAVHVPDETDRVLFIRKIM